MRRVAVVEPLHLSSTRIPAKILQRVGGRRLLDIGIEKLKAIRDRCKVSVFVACWRGDSEIIEAVNESGLLWLPMTEEASRASDWGGIYSGFAALADRSYDWVLHTHATCHPFASVATYAQAVGQCYVADWPFVMATWERSIAWAGAGEEDRWSTPILSSEFLDSRASPILVRPSHLGGGCSVAAFADPAGMGNAVPFVPVRTGPLELLDCDTPADLELLRLVADGRAWRELHRDRQADAPDLWCDGPMAGQSATERR